MDDIGGLPLVVYEDECLVAVRKPARMHSAPGLGAGDLCAWVFRRYPEVETAGAGPRRPRRSPAEGGLLHRLDYETSGIVLFARNSAAFDSLLRQQERGAFYKEYLALSSASREDMPVGSAPRKAFPTGLDARAWADARDRLDGGALAAMLGGTRAGPVSRVASRFRAYGLRGSRVACSDPGGGDGPIYTSDLLTCSAVGGEAESPSGPSPSSPLVEIRVGLSRGFRHQARAHLSWIGLPISGDSLYGGAPDERLRLYAVGLSFEHPATGKRLSLTVKP